MTVKIRRFLASQDGAVTVDWVVLTAAIVGLATIAVLYIRESSVTLADRISEEIGTYDTK